MKLSIDSALNLQILNIVKDQNTNNISNVRSLLPSDYYGIFLDKIYKFPFKVSKVIGSQPKSLSEIDNAKDLKFLGVETEIRWAKAVISKNYAQINSFLSLVGDFSDAFLRDDIATSTKILDEIENSNGASIWLLKTRIAHLQFYQGLESQKKYVQNIKDSTIKGSLSAYISYWVSIRNEKTVTPSRFFSNFDSSLNDIANRLSYGYKEYLRYHILSLEPIDIEEGANILRLEFTKSLYDYYEAFVALMRLIALKGTAKLKTQIKYALSKIVLLIKDERLNYILQILQPETEVIIRPDSHLVQLNNDFLNGDYENCLPKIDEFLRNDPSNPVGIMIAAQASAIAEKEFSLPRHFPLMQIVYKLMSILNNGFSQATSDIIELQKLTINFNTLSWTAAIKLVLDKEQTLFPIYDESSHIEVAKIPHFNPILIEYLDNSPIFETYTKIIRKEGFQFNLNYSGDGGANKKDSISNTLHNALNAFKNQQYNDAFKLGKNLSECSYINFRRRGYGITTYSQFYLKNYRETCISIANYYLSDKSLHSFLPLSLFVQEVIDNPQTWKSVSSLIELPIVLDAYYKHMSKDVESYRRYAYEDFLTENSILRPSQLLKTGLQIENQKIVYYLRYICIEAVMDTSIAFDGTADIANERLEICQELCEIDKENYEVYQTEIKDIIRRQVINSRIQEIDQSRIFIDVQGIREWANKELKEYYLRYLSFLNHGIDSDNSLGKEQERFKNNTTGKGGNAMNVPLNEVHALLVHLITEIRDIYISQDYGLDRFLSTRVRHGQIENQLRGTIIAHNLITNKESQQAPYQPNHYWIDELMPPPHLKHNINKVFASFSEGYDKLISKLKDEWLQIQSEKKRNGLFNFDIPDDLISALGELIKIDTTFEEMLSIVLSKLDTMLQLQLIFVRDQLNSKAKQEARDLLTKLQIGITKYSTEVFTNNLLASINQARTDLQATFNRVIQWFVPSRSGSSTPYTIEDVIRVAEAITKYATPSFEVVIDTESVDENFTMQGSLPIFVDILSNIFENIVKHAKLDSPKAEIILSENIETEDIYIVEMVVKNKLGQQVDLGKLAEELQRKKEVLDSGDYNQYLSRDKNSGLFKIKRSVEDLYAIGYDIKSRMDFGINGDEFVISISIPYRIFNLDFEEIETDSL